jgi:anti-anti-sigma regulatory factor
VPLAAEIDLANCEQAYHELDPASACAAAVVIADFTATRFCDCASLRYLLAGQRRAGAQGGQLRVVSPPAAWCGGWRT